MAGLKQLIQEVHRRSLWQVLGIYLLASWVVFEIVPMTPAFSPVYASGSRTCRTATH